MDWIVSWFTKVTLFKLNNTINAYSHLIKEVEENTRSQLDLGLVLVNFNLVKHLFSHFRAIVFAKDPSLWFN